MDCAALCQEPLFFTFTSPTERTILAELSSSLPALSPPPLEHPEYRKSGKRPIRDNRAVIFILCIRASSTRERKNKICKRIGRHQGNHKNIPIISTFVNTPFFRVMRRGGKT
jgi:hypothetical protein